MADAPFFSTVIAIGIIPVAVLFVYSFLSGRKGWGFHNVSGIIAISWDLTMSMGYFVNRAIGPATSSAYPGPVVAYFIVHGIVSSIVIMIEICVLATGIYNWKGPKKTVWHRRLSNVLFVIWWFSFLSGEIFYVGYYVM